MKSFIETNRTKIIVIVAVLILLISGVWGYNSYINNGMFEKLWSFTKQKTVQQIPMVQMVQKPLVLKVEQKAAPTSDPFVSLPTQLETVDTVLDLVFKYIDKILSSLAALFGLFVLYKEMKKGRRKA